MNALALFWVTDSVSERSAAGPRSGATGTMDHPVYELSSRGSHKDTGTSVHEMVTTTRRQSRRSWSPFVAIDRGLKGLFVREPERRETGTVDVEVSVHGLTSPLNNLSSGKLRLPFTLRPMSLFLLFTKILEQIRRKERQNLFSLHRTMRAPSGCRCMDKSALLYHSIRRVRSPVGNTRNSEIRVSV